MDYLYYLADASLTLRIVDHLCGKPQIAVSCLTVIHLIDGWVVKVKVNPSNPQQEGDFRAVLNELGILYLPPMLINLALVSLEAGQSPIDVMHRYHVAVVCHGSPQRQEIEVFRQQVANGLGYCPQTLR